MCEQETLLHEMVHAWIFLMGIRDGDHGPRFQEKVKAINAATFPDPQVGLQLETYLGVPYAVPLAPNLFYSC